MFPANKRRALLKKSATSPVSVKLLPASFNTSRCVIFVFPDTSSSFLRIACQFCFNFFLFLTKMLFFTVSQSFFLRPPFSETFFNFWSWIFLIQFSLLELLCNSVFVFVVYPLIGTSTFSLVFGSRKKLDCDFKCVHGNAKQRFPSPARKFDH